MNNLAAKITEYRGEGFGWTDATIRSQLRSHFDATDTQIDEAFKEVDAPAPNGHSTVEEVAQAVAVVEQVKTAVEVVGLKQRAAVLMRLNIPVVLVLEGAKKAFQKDWPSLATTSQEQIDIWASQHPNANTAAVAQAKLGGVWFLELDSPDVRKRIEAETGKQIPATFTVRSRKGRGHFYFKQTPASIAMGNLMQTNVKQADWSGRVNNEYVVGPLSYRDDTKTTYEITDDVPLVEAPDWLVAWCASQKVEKKSANAEPEIKRDAQGLIPHGSIHGYLLNQAGKLRAMGLDAEQIEPALLKLVHENCAPPIDDSKVKAMARSICNFPPGENTDLLLTQAAPVQVSNLLIEPQVEQYAMTPEEIDAEMEKDFPVIPLVEQAGPTWDDDIMYGIAGEIIRKASEYCESHPAGMYLDLLVALGNIIGRGPYFNINQTRHYTNEFMARVGLTAESRKGTGRDVVDELLRMVEVEWHRNRIMSGFGSAEAIINEIRDPMEQQIRDKKSPTGFQLIIVPGVNDKRLCIREGELASVFQLAGKRESRADIVLRDGWDGRPLRNLVKGKSRDGLSNSAVCMGPHVSISGDTTRSELISKMPSGAADNGFGNRFLYCYVYRTKKCPNGGPQLDWSNEIPRLYEAIQWAKTLNYVPLTKAASKVWARMYMELDEANNKLAGLAGAMTARGAAHIRRLALIFALLDEYDVVDTKHLHAAKKLWDYCQESAKYVFTGTTAEQDRIIDFVRRNREVTLVQIREDLFKRHKLAAWVETQVKELGTMDIGLARRGDKIVVTR